MNIRKVAVVVVVALLTSSVASAQGPIARGIAEAAQSAASTTQPPSSSSRRPLMVSGIVLIAAGSTLAALAGTAMKQETCVVVFLVAGCVQETNKPVLWTGIAAAGAGGALLAIGASKDLQIGPGRIAYRYRFR